MVEGNISTNSATAFAASLKLDSSHRALPTAHQHRPTVGAGLPAKASDQSKYLRLTLRIRGQARSHIFDRIRQNNPFKCRRAV